MSKMKITARRTCPACERRGKSYGRQYCGYCRGRHQVTKTAIVEDTDDIQRESLLDNEVSDG